MFELGLPAGQPGFLVGGRGACPEQCACGVYDNPCADAVLTVFSNGNRTVCNPLLRVFEQWLDKLRYTRYGFAKYTCGELVEIDRRAGFDSVELVEIERGKFFYIRCKT